MADIPDLGAVKAWLGIPEDDESDDIVLQESLDSALAAQARVCKVPKDALGYPTYPDELREAAMLRTQRLAARKNSPEGVVGLSGVGGDFVSARLPSFDTDVLYLEGPYRKVVVA